MHVSFRINQQIGLTLIAVVVVASFVNGLWSLHNPVTSNQIQANPQAYADASSRAAAGFNARYPTAMRYFGLIGVALADCDQLMYNRLVTLFNDTKSMAIEIARAATGNDLAGIQANLAILSGLTPPPWPVCCNGFDRSHLSSGATDYIQNHSTWTERQLYGRTLAQYITHRTTRLDRAITNCDTIRFEIEMGKIGTKLSALNDMMQGALRLDMDAMRFSGSLPATSHTDAIQNQIDQLQNLANTKRAAFNAACPQAGQGGGGGGQGGGSGSGGSGGR